MIIQTGVDVHVNREKALQNAYYSGREDIVNLLIAAGARPFSNMSYYGLGRIKGPPELTIQGYLLFEPLIDSIIELSDQWVLIMKDQKMYVLRK